MHRIAPVVALLACATPTGPRSEPISELPRPLTQAEQKVIAGSNDFAFALFRAVNAAQRDSNVFISPLSASMALGMTLNGASDQTWEEMRAALRLSDASQQEVNEGYRDLMNLLRTLDPATDMRVANSIWYRQGFPFHANFLEESSRYFDARVQALDFTNQNAALGAINGWVSSATNGRIPTILDQIRANEVMFLINAIYFRGIWLTPFDPQLTAQAPFRALDGTTANVPLMHRAEDSALFASRPAYQAVDLRYGNSAYSMTIVLPNEGENVNTVAESLERQEWESLVGSFNRSRLHLYVPRFRLEWQRELNDVLIQLGMQRAFTPYAAQFGRMSPAGDSLYITRVKQKTFVEVNEQGTEAAAATAVGIGIVSMPPTFRVDRPFLVVIRERFSGTVLFIGKIAKIE